MAAREVLLDPLSEDNLDHLLELEYTSHSPYYWLPKTASEAADELAAIEKFRQQDASNAFVIFDAHQPDKFIGIGEVICVFDRLTMGYFVETGSRNEGYGHAIARAVFAYAVEGFPHRQIIEADIHPDNRASEAIIRSIGFQSLGIQDDSGNDTHWRRLEPLHS